MNNLIFNLDERIRFITKAESKVVNHVRNITTNKLRAFKGDMYEVDIRLSSEPKRLGYQYVTEVRFAACGFDFILDIVID